MELPEDSSRSTKAFGITRAWLTAHEGRVLGPWLRAVGVEWTVILTAIAAAQVSPWWAWVPLWVLVGTRQHALGALLHEGVHRNLLANRRANDALANWLAAYPIFIPVQGYRTSHFRHHRWLETDKDPGRLSLDAHPKDWTCPMTLGHFVTMVLRDASGLGQASSASLLSYLWEMDEPRWPHVVRIVGLQLAFLGLALVGADVWTYLLLWVVPSLTIAPLCYRLRGLSDHSAVGPMQLKYNRSEVDVIASTRTLVPGPILGPLLLPWAASYHVEHHLFPTVGFTNLPELHAQLMRHPDYAQRAHVTCGHTAFLRELLGRA